MGRAFGGLRWFLLAALAAGLAFGEDSVSSGTCRGVALAGRTIQQLDLATSFDVLHLAYVRTLKDSLQAKIGQLVGPRYSDLKVNEAIKLLEDQSLAPLPFFGLPVTASVVSVRASNCTEHDGILRVDLSFFWVPARIPSFLGYSQESHTEQMTDGARAAGVSPRPFWFTPTAGYSGSSKLAGGFSAGVQRPGRAIQTLSASGSASSQLRLFTAGASGSYEPDRRLMKRAAFSFGFDYHDEPAAESRIQSGHSFLEWKTASDLLPYAGLVLRYGLGAQAGAQRASGAVSGDGVAPNTRYGSLQGFLGVTRRWTRQSVAISYALEGERTGGGGVFDFARHFFDASHSFSVSPKHYPIEVDTRFSTGQITNLCRRSGCGAPVAERFFAGNVEHNLLRDESWVIRSSPLLRSFPLNGLSRPEAARRGDERFRAFNLTAAFAVRRKTLVPEDLLREPTFVERIDRLPDTATELLAGAYASQDTAFDADPGIVAARSLLGGIRHEIDMLGPQWDSRGTSIPPASKDDYDICTDDALSVLPLDLDDVDAGKKRITLISNGSGTLAKTVHCLVRFSTGPADPLAGAAERLEAIRAAINLAVSRTDVYTRAKRQAAGDMALGKNTIHTLFHEANLASISPLFIFDAAAQGSSMPGAPAWRYAAGGGVRIAILSSVRFNLGYAVNIHRRAGEGRGAVFAEMDIVDLFGR